MIQELEKRLTEARIVPVIALPAAEDAIPLAEALAEGGLRCAEITFRTDAGRAGIAEIARRMPEFLLGAGTVTRPEEVDAARDAGAQFAVAPGCSRSTLRRAAAAGLPFFPGVMTPSDIEAALEEGCHLLKFFPAETAGGTRMLLALEAPYRHRGVRFIPTGGIDARNMIDYLKVPGVVAVGGSWIVAPELLRERRWKDVTRLTAAAVKAVRPDSA